MTQFFLEHKPDGNTYICMYVFKGEELEAKELCITYT